MSKTEAKFVDDPTFGEPDAERRIFTEAPEVPRPDASWYIPFLRGEGRSVVSCVFTRQQHTVLFNQFGLARYLAARGPDADRWARVAAALREQIAQANLGLVPSLVRQYGYGAEPDELIAEGNHALVRAIEGFDPRRGWAFSTYVSAAVTRAWSRNRGKAARRARHGQVYLASSEAATNMDAAASSHLAAQRATCAAEHREDQVAAMLGALESPAITALERQVLTMHFGLAGTEPQPLYEVGLALGVSAERARQISRKAIAKVRAVLRPSPPLVVDERGGASPARKHAPYGSVSAAVVAMLAERACTVAEIAAAIGGPEHRARSAISALVHQGRPIRRVGPQTYAMVK